MSPSKEYMSTVDFALVKMAHQTWRLKLRTYLSGREDIDASELVSHWECTLGKWIYSIGISRYGHNRDLQHLERVHKQMHLLVKEVLDMKRLGRTQEAERQYTKVREAADRVLQLLSRVEEQIR